MIVGDERFAVFAENDISHSYFHQHGGTIETL